MAGMRRFPKGADAQSKETTYSGLPKSCCRSNAANGAALTANVAYPVVVDVTLWNDGPFTFPSTTEIQVHEPGVYWLQGQVTFNTPALGWEIDIVINGNFIAGQPFLRGDYSGATAYAPGGGIGGPQMLRAKDIVKMQVVSPSLYIPLGPGYCWLYVRKEGGQY